MNLATGYGLDARRSGVRFPAESRIFALSMSRLDLGSMTLWRDLPRISSQQNFKVECGQITEESCVHGKGYGLLDCETVLTCRWNLLFPSAAFKNTGVKN